MQEQRSLTPAEEDRQADSALLAVLTDHASQRPWARDELSRALAGDPEESLDRLHAAGLIHRLHGFVWASRSAIAAEELDF